MQRTHRGLGRALCAAGTALLLVAAALGLLAAGPRLLGCESYQVLSGSMAPAIPAGSLAVVKPMAGAELAPGEVAAFYRGTDVVLHRVVENRRPQAELITQGDANPAPDPAAVPYGAVVGRVVWHGAGLGVPAAALAGWPGKVCLMGLAAAGLALSGAGALMKKG